MFVDMLSNAIGQLVGELLGETLDRKFERRAMLREIAAAVVRAEQRFASEYRAQDAELADVLTAQTRFADLPSVRAALRELLTQPFHDPARPTAALRQSFADVLPRQVDRQRVDAAVHAFLHYLGQEVLYIPQLRELYTLMFQKLSAESSRNVADHTAALVQTMRELQENMRQIASVTPAQALPPSRVPPAERQRPWHNLPQRSYTQFIGRQAELEKLHQLLLPHPQSRHFVVTLDGIGGVGKSALALELAYIYRDSYGSLPPSECFEAIVWASAKRTLLTASGIQQRRQTFNTLDDLYGEIATVLELPDMLQAGNEQRRSLVERALSAQRTLLIVDNLETVDDEGLLTFLRELPDPTKAIVTTRHRIDIAYTIRLTGMEYGDALLLMAVEAATKGVELLADAMEDLFRRTGGVPLAIVWSIGLMSMGHGVDSVLRRLGSGQSDIARFCFAESVARIHGRDAHRLLLALALFERSVSRGMLGAVAGLGDDLVGRDDGLAELLRLSLVNQRGERFKLLPLTHSFALDELAGQPEVEQELRRHWIEHLTTLARPYAAPHWQHPDRRGLAKEGTHLVALANWAQQATRPDVLLPVVPALFAYYDLTGRWGDMVALGELATAYARLVHDRASLRQILNMVGWILSQQGQHQAAEQAVAEAYGLATEIGDITWQCEILIRTAQIARRTQAFALAAERCRQAQLLLPAVGDPQRPYVRADIEIELGKIARDQSDWLTAQRHFTAARAVFRLDIENPVFNVERAWGAYSQFAYVAHQLGDLEGASAMYRESLAALRELGSRGYLATLLLRYASLEAQSGNHTSALNYARESLDWSCKLGMVQEMAAAAGLLETLRSTEGR